MLEVLDHTTGTTTTYATKLEALAAGRRLARQLAAARACDGLLEDPDDDRLLIYGTAQDTAGRIIDAPPLVRVSFPRKGRASQRG
jgi:hypothetical protein